MWPSFSLCAWRILKMRSCLRRPLAPGRSSGASYFGKLGDVLFFEFRDGHVHLRRDMAEGQAGRIGRGTRRSATRLCSAPLSLGSSLRFYHQVLAIGISDAMQHLVGRILDTGVGHDETSALPWKPTGRACNGCAAYELLRIRDRTASSFS